MKKSKRYCLICKKDTTWKKKTKEHHSSCSICGNRSGIRTLDQLKRGYNPKKKNKTKYKYDKKHNAKCDDEELLKVKNAMEGVKNWIIQ